MGQGSSQESETKMVKKSNKKDGENVDDIIEEVKNISGGTPTSPAKVKNNETDLSASLPSDSVKTFSKLKKQDLSVQISTSSVESPLQQIIVADQESPSKSKNAERSPPARSPAAPKAKKEVKARNKSPATPTKKRGKRAASPLPVSPKKVKRDTKAKKIQTSKDSPKSTIAEKAENLKNTKKSPKGKMIAVKGLPNGWKKTSITRQSGKTAGQVDVYFFAPDGTKLRSKPDVVAYLKKKKLTHKIELFNFSKRSVASSKLDPKEEVISKKLKKPITKNEEVKAKEKVRKHSKLVKVKEEKKIGKKEGAEVKDGEDESDIEVGKDQIVKEDLEEEANELKEGKDKDDKNLKKGSTKKPKESKKDEPSEDNMNENPSDIAENGEGKSSGSNEEKKDLEKGNKVTVQVRDYKTKRLRK